MMVPSNETIGDAEYRRLAVVSWLEENLDCDALGREAASDTGMVSRILEEGPKAIRAILKESRWHKKRKEAGGLYSSLQAALKSATKNPEDPLYHAPWQSEPFTTHPLEVGVTENPPESAVELRGDAEEAIDALQRFLPSFLSIASDESVAHEYDELVRVCSRMNPSFDFHFDLSDARRRLHDGGDPAPLENVLLALSRQVCFPARRVFLPIGIQADHIPEYYNAHILGEWRRHEMPIGEAGFSNTVRRERQRQNTVYIQTAMTFKRFFFLDEEAKRAESDDHYRIIQARNERNPFWLALRCYLRSQRVDAGRYHDVLEKHRTIFEECEHIYDQNCIELYRQQHPHCAQHVVAAEALIAPRGGSLSRLWDRRKNTPLAFAMYPVTAEFIGQLGSVIKHMKMFIDRGEKAMSFAAFLNFMGIIQHTRMQREGIEKLRRGDSLPIEDFFLEVPNGAYLLLGEMFLSELDPPHGSAVAILQKCQGSGEHPAEIALQLLEQAYARNSQSVTERKEMLGLS